MIPGPDKYYKCPNCGANFYTHSLISGNTIGARHYSDGEIIAPMLPEYPNLTKCEECGTIVKLSRLTPIIKDDFQHAKEQNIENGQKKRIRLWKKFGKTLSLIKSVISDGQQEAETQEIKHSHECRPLGTSDLYRALDIFPEDELYIRLRIWRGYNDIFRFPLGIEPCDDNSPSYYSILDTEEYRNNCLVLLNLLNKDKKDERLALAEINRNLGNFAECLNLIPKSERENFFEKILISECKIGNRSTIRIDNYFEILEAIAKREAEKKEKERIKEEMKDPRWKVCPNGHCFENIRTECKWCGEKNVVERLDKNVCLQHKILYVGKQNGKYILTSDANIPGQEDRIRKITVDYYQDKFLYFHLDGKNPNPFLINNIQLNHGHINGRDLTKLCEDIVAGKYNYVDLSNIFID